MLDDSVLNRPSLIRRVIAWITLVAYVGQPLAVTAQVAADQAAAPSNRPVVDSTANGLPLVQITTPSAAGVSHNQYTHFNVDPAGLILNNSATVVQTQQAGYVIANPNLVNGAARVILNEVTSTNVSQLNGYTEVAGQRAEVIIANPNGITCNGCGFINTGRGVLTTGTPVMGAGGSLDAFRVTGGQIQIGIAGMNGSNLDQIDLIARSVKVNGELWAADLNVITGANLVNYNTFGVQLIQGDASKPTVGIDVALLGGMYANKIRLVGTEAGVGVNSLGNLSAQAGDFILDNQGQITLGGDTIASANLTVNSNTSVANSGTLYSQQTAQLNSTGSIDNSGLLSAQGNLILNAANLNSTGTLGAGIDVNGNATQNGNILITTQNQATATGQNISGGRVNIDAADINLANSNTNAWSGVTLDALAGNIELTGAMTQTMGDIVLNATGALLDNQGTLYGAAITSTSAGFSNTGGNVYASGTLNINSSIGINNQGGVLSAANQALLASQITLDNTNGKIFGQSALTIQSGSGLVNPIGLLQTNGDLNLTIAAALNNQAGKIEANGVASTFNLTAASIDNTLAGRIANTGTGATVINGGTLIINTGILGSNGDLSINAASLHNNQANSQKGLILSGNNLTLNVTNSLNNTNGQIYAFSNLDFNRATATLDNTWGDISSNGNSTFNLASINNLSGKISSGSDISLTTTALNGTGQILANRNATINLQGNYTNSAGNIFSANGDLAINISGSLTNQTALNALGKLTVTAANITNQAGASFNSSQTSLSTLGNIVNDSRIDGSMISTTSNNFTNNASVIGNSISITSNNLTNQGVAAIIAATQSINLIIQSALANQDGATIYSLGDVNIGAAATLDAAGYLTGNSVSVTNRSATIEANGNLRISADQITNKRTVVGFEWGSQWTGAYVGGNPRYTPYYQNEQLIAATTSEARLLSGSDMWLKGGIGNEYSTVASGSNLSFNAALLSQTSRTLLQHEIDIGEQDNWVYLQVGSYKCGFFNACGIYAWVNYPVAYYAERFVPVGSANATFTANNRITGTAVTVSNQAVTGTNGPVGGMASTLSATFGTTNSGQTGSAQSSAPFNTAVLYVPTSGLYTIHTQPGQRYLVETDARFANYQNFLSSDYMLSRLTLDPQGIQKRLGDGFYEQKLITDQITGLTGRRHLGQNLNAEEQYKSLMDSGVAVAMQFNLVPGVALSASQMAALTSDIVWMVEQEVILANGAKERVLVPQVYLSRLHATDLSPSGALIAADDISIQTSGTLQNSGTIKGGTRTILTATDIVNRGGTLGSGGDNILQAGNDILNQSGSVNGQRIAMLAGRDIRNERVISGITQGAVATTLIHREAGINATDSLDIQAGRNLAVSAANINAGGNASLGAGRDLEVKTIATQESTVGRFGDASRAAQLTSQIQTGGNLNLTAANDLQLTSANLSAGQNLNLAAGGNVTLDTSKDSTRSQSDTGFMQERRYDETVLGTTLKAGGNVMLVATDGKGQGRDKGGNITLESAAMSSKSGNINVVADTNVNVGSVEEKHESFRQTRIESKGFLSSTTTTTRDESNRTSAIGSNLDGDRITIQSGHDINVTGSNASANQDITLAAMNDINIFAATETYKQNHSREEVTNGLITGGSFGFTVGQDKSTTQTNTDGATQSQSRSTINSTSGNLNLLSGGNTIIIGSDLAATQGAFTSAASGSIAIFAGLDSLNQYTESHHDQDTGLFSKQKLTITDTLITSQYAGSTLATNTLDLQAGANLILQAAKLNSTGNTNLAAAGDVQLLSVTDSIYTNHTEKLQTEGTIFKPDGMIDVFGERRKNSQTTSQTQVAKVTAIQSGGNLSSSSGGNTLIEASQLNANGSVDLTAGYDANGQLIMPDASITFAAVKDSTYLKAEDNHSSLAWQSQGGSGDVQETIKLANISAGKGLNLNATGGVVVDIPEVPVPVESTLPVDPNTADSTGSEQGTGANNAASSTINIDTRTPQQRLDDHRNTLAQQPGQEWIRQLANDPRTKVQWQQTNAAVEHWDYSHEGITPEAAGVIAVVVAYASAGAASEAAAGIVSSASATTGVALSATASAAATSAVTAGLITLASQASVSLVNNKGDIGKTLDDLGKKESVRNIVAAMLTAGVAGSYGRVQNLERFSAQTLTGCVTGDMTGRGCENGSTTAAIMTGSEWVNREMRDAMKDDSKQFEGVRDTNDPSGKNYSNMSGGGSAGIDGDGTRESGTRISKKGLKEFGTVIEVTPKTWTFTGRTNPATGQPYSLIEALTAQTGLTGGSQALGQTFAGMPVAPGSFMDKVQESFAGPHDYFGGRIERGYDNLGNWKVASDFADGVREIAAGGNIVLVAPLVIPTLLRQLHIDPVAIVNIVQNGTKKP